MAFTPPFAPSAIVVSGTALIVVSDKLGAVISTANGRIFHGDFSIMGDLVVKPGATAIQSRDAIVIAIREAVNQAFLAGCLTYRAEHVPASIVALCQQITGEVPYGNPPDRFAGSLPDMRAFLLAKTTPDGKIL